MPFNNEDIIIFMILMTLVAKWLDANVINLNYHGCLLHNLSFRLIISKRMQVLKGFVMYFVCLKKHVLCADVRNDKR